MFRKTVSLLLVLLLTLGAVPVLAEDTAVRAEDSYGRSVELEAPAERVVALTAADCEILCALGCEEALIGIGAYCDYPATILDRPVVNSGSETNIEQIIALDPQLVLMEDMNQSKEVVDALEAAGIRVAVSTATDIEGVYGAIRMIGTLLGADEAAEALVSDMEQGFEEIRAQAVDEGKTVYFEVSPLEWGLWTAGKGTFMDELATLCGLTNAFADVDGWAEISEEQVLERDPDYIVTIATYYGEGPTPVEEIMSRAGWAGLKAVSLENVFNADDNQISRPGPRLKEAALALFDFVKNGEDALTPAA